jgi:Viral BACON domain
LKQESNSSKTSQLLDQHFLKYLTLGIICRTLLAKFPNKNAGALSADCSDRNRKGVLHMIFNLRNATGWLFLIILLLKLTACGGGGDGDGNGNNDAFSVSPASITFAAIQNGLTPATQYSTITVNSGTVFLDVQASGSAFTADLQLTGPVTGSITISPVAPTVAPGTYTGTITVTGCSTSNCASGQVAGSPKTIAVTYTIQPRTGIVVSPQSLSFSQVKGGTAPVPQSFALSENSGASYPWSASIIYQSGGGWLNINGAGQASGGSLPASPSLTINPITTLGTYNAIVRVTGNGHEVDIPVSYTVREPQISASPASLTFSSFRNDIALPGVQDITLSTEANLQTSYSVAVTYGAGASGWITAPANGAAPGPFAVGVNSTNLNPGTYTATLSLTTPTQNLSINVTYSVSQLAFTFSPASLSFGGNTGRDLSNKTLQISLNTGANAYNWSVSSANSWLQVTPASGLVSSSPVTVTASVNASALTDGAHSGSIVFSAQVNGNAVTGTVPVTALIDSHKVLVSDPGVAFASMPSLSRLSRTLKVSSNYGATIAWSANSSQPWLSVTANGMTTGDLVFTANPSGLAADTVHYATVSVSSSEATVQNTETVRVGLWVGSSDPSATTTISSTHSRAIVDPIRPYAYLHSGGTGITVYNIYSGAVVATIPSVAAQLANLAISKDGSRLFAVDATNFTIVPVDLPSYAVGNGWPIGAPVSPILEYLRLNGIGMVISGNSRFYNATTGYAYSATFDNGSYYGNYVVATSLDGTRLCTLNTGVSSSTLTCSALEFSPTSGVQLGTPQAAVVSGFGADVAINADGTRVYVATAGNDGFNVYNSTTMHPVQLLPAAIHPNNVEVARDGRIFAGSSNPYGPLDVWIYSTNGTQLASFRVSDYTATLYDRQLSVSGDGIRMITLSNYFGSNSPALKFTTVGP